jgi:Ras-related protein Rab-7A
MASKKKQFLKIVILGDSGVGKTTLLQQYVNQKVSGHAKPTIGADFSKKEVLIDNAIVNLQIWDTAGQEKFQSLGYAFYRGADCCALVYDITNQRSFDNLTKWKEGFIEHAAPTDPKQFPFVLIGNKLDKEPERKVKTQDAKSWCKENEDMPYYETSALENIAVDGAFIEMAKMAIKRESQNQVFTLPDSIGGAGGAIKLNQKDD